MVMVRRLLMTRCPKRCASIAAPVPCLPTPLRISTPSAPRLLPPPSLLQYKHAHAALPVHKRGEVCAVSVCRSRSSFQHIKLPALLLLRQFAGERQYRVRLVTEGAGAALATVANSSTYDGMTRAAAAALWMEVGWWGMVHGARSSWQVTERG